MDGSDLLIMIPGPTGLPPEVREALARPQIGHRTPEFAALIADCTAGLQYVFRTANDLLILTASGTGGMEAAVTNCLSPGDPVLAVSVGNFGERLGTIAEVFGANVTWVRSEWGEAADASAVREALAKGNYKAVLFTQNETSTAITNPVAELAALAREAGALTIVDAISGMGGTEIRTDAWGLDVVVAGSQKALMLPPGLAFACLSEHGWAAAEQARMPRYYTDLPKALASLQKGQTPYTPNVNMILALQASLRLIEAEGLLQFQDRHRRMARACRAAARAAGLTLLADDACASDVVTAIVSPEGMDSGKLVKALREKHNIIISGGQDALKGKIFRIGHLGAAQASDLLRTWEAVGRELGELGHACDVDAVLTELEDVYHGL